MRASSIILDVLLIPGNEIDLFSLPEDCLTARYLPFSSKKCSQPIWNFRHRGLTLELEEAILLSDAEPLTRDPLVELSFTIKCCFYFSMSFFFFFFSSLSQNIPGAHRSPFVFNPSSIRKNSGQYITLIILIIITITRIIIIMYS